MRVSRELRHSLSRNVNTPNVNPRSRGFPFIIVFLTILIAITVFFPPASLQIILIYILLISATTYGLLRIRMPRKYSLLTAVFVLSVLLLKASQLFDTINVVLLISLFVGIFALIK